MAKRSSNQWDSVVVEDIFPDEEIIEETSHFQVKLEPPASVWLQCQYPANVIVIGSVTGRTYTFNGGGSMCEVNALDVPKMLEKVHGTDSCCGESKPRPYFVIM